MPYAEFVAALNLVLLAILSIRGTATRLIFKYPVFFGYLLVQTLLAVSSQVIALIYGIRSQLYSDVYYLTLIVTPILQLWVLWDLLRRLLSERAEMSRITRLLLVTSIILVTPVAWSMGFAASADAFYRYETAALTFQMIFCFLIYLYLLERRDIDPGRNLRGILGGVALMVGCQALNFMNLLSQQTSYDAFRLLVPSIYALALIVFLRSLWEYDPLRQIEQRREVNAHLQRGLRSMLQLIFPW